MDIEYVILLYIVKITEEQPRAGALFLLSKGWCWRESG